ncbi:Serine/threonine-protein kinase RIO2 [Clonorchis sinensis]|uniref:non-specific serine/threonine protein kinase n=1 Tax=Clonorchis sinensis TaxID=79923 RepID=A0A3R7FGJ0_CLOSI|nr:Serine/threonine-protein kinase RIO2 [Clonorchis sinensis]
MPKTIRLDSFRYITNEAWRALIAIEMGMKNHEVVPLELAQKISRCKRSGSGFLKLIKDQLVSNSLVAYESDSRRCVCGYRLTNLGYDYLALHQLFNSGQLCDLGTMIGAGKESDVYLAVAGNNCGQQIADETTFELMKIDFGSPVVVKFHRLGRTSFRKVKEKREYHQHRKACSWLYLDRLASSREFLMMKALHSHHVAVPQPLAHNRNAVVMSYVADSCPLSRVVPSVLRVLEGLLAKELYSQAREMLQKIASLGLIHGDFNEFNLMVVGLGDVELDAVTEDTPLTVKLVLIDFPQMISRAHPTAETIYRRDAEGIVSFFSRFFEIPEEDLPLSLSEITRTAYLDVEVKAPGFPSKKFQRRGRTRDDHQVLLGATSRRKAPCSEDDGDDESNNSSEDSECEVSSAESIESDQDSAHRTEDEESQSAEQSSLDDEPSDKTDLRPIPEAKLPTVPEIKPTNSNGLISQEEIRARHRREKRQQEQMNFQRNVKRHMRANVKRQGRASLKAELTLFG